MRIRSLLPYLGAQYQFANAEAALYVAAMTVPPSFTRKRLIDNYVGALKSAGIWPLLDILHLVAAHDQQAARLNLKAPASFDCVNVGAGPAFVVDRGTTGNGVDQAWSTQFTPSLHASAMTQNSASEWVWCLTNVAENAADCGAAVTHNTFIRSRSAGDAISVTVNGATTTTAIMANSIGMTGVSRLDAVNQQIWKNGVAQGAAAAGASTGLPATAVRIGGRGNDLYSTKQIAFHAMGADLGGREAAFYAATLAYMQGVGAA